MNIETPRRWPLDSLEWLRIALIVQGMLAAALLAMGFVGHIHVRLMVVFDGRWWSCFAVALVVVIGTAFRFATLHDREPRSRSLDVESWLHQPRELGRGLVAVVVLAVPFVWFAEFEGIPALLHYCTRQQGRVTLTLAGKQDAFRRQSCRPRWIIAEFSGIKDELCPDLHLFDGVAVGERIEVQGQVSPYGVEVTHVIQTRHIDRQSSLEDQRQHHDDGREPRS